MTSKFLASASREVELKERKMREKSGILLWMC